MEGEVCSLITALLTSIYKFYKIFLLYSGSVSFFEQVIELLKKKKNPQDLYMINGNKAGIIVFVFFLLRYGGTITNQIKRLGASCDWSRERFTLDEQLSRKAFFL